MSEGDLLFEKGPLGDLARKGAEELGDPLSAHNLKKRIPAEPFVVTPSMLLHPANRPAIEAIMRSFGISEKALSAHFKALEV